MRYRLLATAATIGLTISPAMGQGVTDQDLRVGYCLGAMHGVDTSNLDSVKLAEYNTSRFQRYLFARGYLSNPSFENLAGILMAAKQGEYDIREARSNPQDDRMGAELNSCQNDCARRYPWSPGINGEHQNFDQFRICSDSCWNLHLPDTVKRLTACFDLAKQLPF